MGSGTVLQGGISHTGDRPAISDGGPQSGVPYSRYHRDPTVQIFGSYPPYSFNLDDVGPVTAVWATQNGSQLTVTQRCSPSSLTVLGIGPFLQTPVAGPPGLLVVDPDASLLCWAIAPTTGNLQTQFAIPTGLPAGFQVGLQSLEVTTQSEFSLSNTTVFGIW